MRLTTLARKIGISPGNLRQILDKEGLPYPEDPNVKLDKTAIRTILNLYGEDEADEPQPGAGEESSSETTNEAIEEETIDENEQPPANSQITDKPETSDDPKKEGTVDDLLEAEDAENIELIKAKKIQLEGVKIVGKIELPDTPEKKIEEDSSVDEEEKAAEKTPKSNSPRKQREKRKSRGLKQKRRR